MKLKPTLPFVMAATFAVLLTPAEKAASAALVTYQLTGQSTTSFMATGMFDYDVTTGADPTNVNVSVSNGFGTTLVTNAVWSPTAIVLTSGGSLKWNQDATLEFSDGTSDNRWRLSCCSISAGVQRIDFGGIGEQNLLFSDEIFATPTSVPEPSAMAFMVLATAAVVAKNGCSTVMRHIG